MKKLGLLLMLFGLIICFAGCGGGGGTDDPKPVSENITFIFYANSYDLDSGLVNNIIQMCNFGSNEKINIVVNYKLSDETVWRGLIRKSDGSDITKGLSNMGHKNFGDPQNLSEFVNWAVSNYPADNYVLCLWNHGTGWTPYWDTKAINHDADYNDCLECYEIDEALRNKGMDVICFDACCMQMLETLTYIKKDASLCVASQEEIPSTGYNYTNLLYALTNENLTDALVIFAKEQIKDSVWKRFDADIHVTDLSKIDDINSNIKTVSEYLISHKEKSKEISYARQETYLINYFEKDMKGFLSNLKNRIDSSEFEYIVDRAIESMDNALIYNGVVDYKTGFGVNLPSKSEYESEFGNYALTAFAQASGWDKFLKTLE